LLAVWIFTDNLIDSSLRGNICFLQNTVLPLFPVHGNAPPSSSISKRQERNWGLPGCHDTPTFSIKFKFLETQRFRTHNFSTVQLPPTRF